MNFRAFYPPPKQVIEQEEDLLGMTLARLEDLREQVKKAGELVTANGSRLPFEKRVWVTAAVSHTDSAWRALGYAIDVLR